MDPIKFTINIQRFTALIVGASFLGLSATLTFINPYNQEFGFWLFLFLLYVFISGAVLLVAFWWVFGVKKEILMVGQVNQLIYQSLVSAGFIILAFILNHTENLTLINLIILIIVFLMYYFWSSN